MTTTAGSAAPAAPPHAPSPVRGARLARGLVLLAFGLTEAVLVLFAFRIPNVTAHGLLIVLSACATLDGLAALVGMARARGRGGAWGLPACSAVVGLVAGAAIMANPAGSALTLFAWWAIVTGLLEAAEGARLGVAVSLAFGILVLAGPIESRVMLILLASAYGILAGSIRLANARRH